MIKQKFRILFNRAGQPGSIIETVLYVESKEQISNVNKELEYAFYQYFSRKRYTYKRAIELPVTDKDRTGVVHWFKSRGDSGEDFIF